MKPTEPRLHRFGPRVLPSLNPLRSLVTLAAGRSATARSLAWSAVSRIALILGSVSRERRWLARRAVAEEGEWLDVEAAAEHVRLPVNTIYRMVRDGRLPALRFPVRIRREDLDTLLDRCRTSPASYELRPSALFAEALTPAQSHAVARSLRHQDGPHTVPDQHFST